MWLISALRSWSPQRGALNVRPLTNLPDDFPSELVVFQNKKFYIHKPEKEAETLQLHLISASAWSRFVRLTYGTWCWTAVGWGSTSPTASCGPWTGRSGRGWTLVPFQRSPAPAAYTCGKNIGMCLLEIQISDFFAMLWHVHSDFDPFCFGFLFNSDMQIFRPIDFQHAPLYYYTKDIHSFIPYCIFKVNWVSKKQWFSNILFSCPSLNSNSNEKKITFDFLSIQTTFWDQHSAYKSPDMVVRQVLLFYTF